MNRGWLLVLVAVFALGGGYLFNRLQHPQSGEQAAQPPVTDPLAASFRDLEGKAHPLAEWRGKVLVVNFWATWCPPCLKEIPAFIELQRQLGGRGLQLVGVALDSPEEVSKFASARGLSYPLLVGEEDVASYMRDQGNSIGALPFTLVFDRAGVLRHMHQGEWTGPELAQVLEPYLSR